ncbi:formate dehydrogenase accessory sulfurtransferase FdhD [Chloroflexota bacterium]
MSILSTEPLEMETEELTSYSHYANGEWQRSSSRLPDEMLLHIFVNDFELVSILCTPEKLNYMLIGYLLSEGFIDSIDEITLMRVCLKEAIAEVRLNHQITSIPTARILTSGCGGGATFDQGTNIQPLDSGWCVSPAQILSSVKVLQRKSENRGENNSVRRGLHASALSDGDNIIVRADDIGRHNTLDKIRGECTFNRIPTEDLLLVTTGRISSEMLVKVAKMGIPVVASINSATRRAVSLGAELGITVVGYASGNRLSVFSGEERLLVAAN